MSESHWTDAHIKYNDESGLWQGFDEIGELLASSDERDTVKQALIEYAENEL